MASFSVMQVEHKVVPSRCNGRAGVIAQRGIRLQGQSQGQQVATANQGFIYWTANRVIYWRTSQNRVELVESSLNHNLHGNALRLNFQGSPIIPRVSIHETHSHVVVLIATFTSVHRLPFPHPNKLNRQDSNNQFTSFDLTSIFADASVTNFRDASNIHEIVQGGAQTYEFQACGSWMTGDGEAWFALSVRSGSLVLVKMAPLGLRGITTQNEVKESSIMERLLTGLVPVAIRQCQEGWQPVYLETDQLTSVQVPAFLDPREAYLDHIFKPGRFSVQTILRALHTYSRSAGSDLGTLMDVDLPDPSILRQDASIVVETEIQQRVGGGEVSQGEYRQLVEQSMSKFLACCVEYHQVANKPLGLFLDRNTHMPCLIKRNLLSVLQPVGLLEDLHMGVKRTFSMDDLGVELSDEDPTILQDMQSLQECIHLLSSSSSVAMEMQGFTDSLMQLERPVDVAQKLASKLLMQDG
eukprot:XP_011661620.1 PREDICTED: nuclear pore complex protein Nup160 [Strongylocentrotus purpuratus]